MSHLSKTLTIFSLSALLAACSTSHESKRQINGSVSYLEASQTMPLKAPAGIILPLQYGDFSVPTLPTTGAVGMALDIRPPLQPLALLPGARVQSSANQAEIIFESQGVTLTQLVQSVITSKGYAILNSGVDDATHRSYWTTDWVNWRRLDEKSPYEARYEISALSNGYSHVIHVRLTDLRSKGEAITNPTEIARYTVMMLNAITEGIYAEQNKQSAQTAADSVGSFIVQNATDETGLAQMVIRAPYAVVWQALPSALSNIGMTIGDSNRSNGLMNVNYKPLSDSQLALLSAQNVKLKSGDYALQVGDLGNRTSLQFRSSKGQPVSSEDNEALTTLMQAAFNLARPSK